MSRGAVWPPTLLDEADLAHARAEGARGREVVARAAFAAAVARLTRPRQADCGPAQAPDGRPA